MPTRFYLQILVVKRNNAGDLKVIAVVATWRIGTIYEEKTYERP